MEQPSRRFFLKSLFGTVASIPIIGASTSIFLDSTKVFNPYATFTEEQILFLELDRIRTKLPQLFDQDDTFFQAIYGGAVGGGKTIRIPLLIRPGGKFDRY